MILFVDLVVDRSRRVLFGRQRASPASDGVIGFRDTGKTAGTEGDGVK